MQIEAQKKGKEGESKIEGLQKELVELEKKLDLAREEEKLSDLKNREVTLRADFEQSVKAGKEDKKLRIELRDLVEEVWIQEKKLEGLRSNRDEKVEALKMAVAAKRRDFCERETSRLLPQIESLKKELTAVTHKLFCLGSIWDKNNPVKLVRSHSRFIQIRKVAVKQKDGNYLPGGMEVRDGFVLSQCELHRLESFVKDGWQVWPEGQDLQLEPQSFANSTPYKTVPVPPVISRIGSLSFSEIETYPTDEEVLAVEKEIDAGTGS